MNITASRGLQTLVNTGLIQARVYGRACHVSFVVCGEVVERLTVTEARELLHQLAISCEIAAKNCELRNGELSLDFGRALEQLELEGVSRD